MADDEHARVYVADEDIGGIDRWGAEPGDPTTPVRIDTTTETGGHVVQDIKGLSMYYGRGGAATSSPRARAATASTSTTA